MSGVYLAAPVELHAFGLTPGTKYCASMAFTADSGVSGFNLGFSVQAVKSNGTITFAAEATDVNPGGVPGTVKAWIRAGSATGGNFDDPPQTAPDGTVLETEIHLP